MKRIAIYPGSFDPVTLGHMDIIRRAARIFDHVIVAVAGDPGKQPALALDERLSLLRRTTRGMKRVSIESFNGLLVNYVRRRGASVIIRGLRAVSDFEYEFQLALTNRKLAPEVETVFLMPDEPYTYLSASLVRELARLGGNIGSFVPSSVAKTVFNRFRRKNAAAGRRSRP